MRKTLYDADYRKILQRLISARKQKMLTQEGLAMSLKRPQSFVSKYERGERRLDILEFINVCKFVGLDPCDVIQEVLLKKAKIEVVQARGRA